MAAPVYDNSAFSTGSGVQTSTLTQSWTQDVAAGANNCGIVACAASNNGSGTFVPTGSPPGTASIGGTPLTYRGSILLGNLNIAGFIAVWADLGVASGLGKTCTYSMTDSGVNVGNAFGLSATYLGVGAIGALQSAFDTAAADSVTVPSAITDLVWGLCSQYSTGAYVGDFTLTLRQGQGASGPAFVMGDGAGATPSKVVSCTKSGAFQGAAVALDLQPVVASSATQFFEFM